MPSERDLLLDEVSRIVSQVFRIPVGYSVTRATSAADVDGWDSLSHSILMMKVEEELGIELPLDRIFDLSNIGDLVDVLIEIKRPQP